MSIAGRFYSLPLGVLLGAVALVGGGSSLIEPAHATSIAPLSLEQMVDASDVIARGTVTDVWSDLGDRGVRTHLTLHVDRAIKGSAIVNSAGDLEILVPGGDLDGNITLVDGSPRYGAGERVVVLLEERKDGSYLNVALGAGKYTIKQNPTDASDMVVQFTVPYDRAWDYRFIPNPAAESRVSLASLEARLEARVALGWDGQPIPGTTLEHLRSINHLQLGVR